jgi:5-(carboxyamino)imidazole ribonucleotide mutase
MNGEDMKVAILMGSKSDEEVVSKAEKMLGKFGVAFEKHIISAHRTPEKAAEFAKNAEKNGFGAIIAAAGKAAHLAGVIAGHTILPVIGLPMKTSDLGGMDSLLSIVQMPKGVPVATVAINGAENAAILAVQILAGADESLKEKLREYKKELAQ